MTKKYVYDRKNINITNDNAKLLDDIKNKFGLKSYDKVIDLLVRIEKQTQTKIEKSYKCNECGKQVNLSTSTKPERLGLLHNHLENTDCIGCIESFYKIIITSEQTEAKEEQSEQIEAKEEQSEQTEAKEEQTKEEQKSIKKYIQEKDSGIDKRQKTPEEIEKEEWETNPLNPKNYVIDPY